MYEPRLFEPPGVVERVQVELIRWSSGWEVVLRTWQQGSETFGPPEVYAELTWSEAVDVICAAGL